MGRYSYLPTQHVARIAVTGAQEVTMITLMHRVLIGIFVLQIQNVHFTPPSIR